MITKIEIDGFKSFSDFQMEFTPFTVIAGTNASGKSNLFDALHLLSNLAVMDLRTAFSYKNLRGDVKELFTQYGDKVTARKMHFAVELLVERKIVDNWGGQCDIKTPRLRYELTIARKENGKGFEELVVEYEYLTKINTDDDKWAKKYLGEKNKQIWKNSQSGGSSKPYIYTEQINGVTTIRMRQDGRQGGKAAPANAVNQTVLASVATTDFPHVLAAKKEISNWNFMQLNPEILREPTRYEINLDDKIGHSGENLAAALYRIKEESAYNLQLISFKLNSFLPEFTSVDVLDDTANKQFLIRLKNEDGKVFTSRVLSEGTLRLLTLCILLYDDKYQGLLCFEEPENGIHPFRIATMVELLRELSTSFEKGESLRQVIVNTHSPVFLRVLKTHFNDEDIFVSIWFSKLTTKLITKEEGKRKLRTSKMVPLTKDLQYSFSEADIKMTIADATRYLESQERMEV